MRNNILITSVGKRYSLVKSFKETLSRFFPKSSVFTTDMNPNMAPAGYVSDGCFKVPRVTADEYVDTLYEICLKNNVGLVIPTIDTELLTLSANRVVFLRENINISVSDYNFISVCRDKRRTGIFFKEKGIRIPQAIDIHHPSFPMFAKPYDGSLSSDLHYIKTKEDLTPDILNNPKLMFMEYIDKSQYKEFTADLYYDKTHKLIMAVPRERIEIRAGEINKGRTVKKFLEKFIHEHLSVIEGCRGCICVQLFYDELSEDIVGIEINPRFGGGYPLSYAAGANFPEFLIREYFLNEALMYSDNWTDGKLMLRYDDAVFK